METPQNTNVKDLLQMSTPSRLAQIKNGEKPTFNPIGNTFRINEYHWFHFERVSDGQRAIEGIDFTYDGDMSITPLTDLHFCEFHMNLKRSREFGDGKGEIKEGDVFTLPNHPNPEKVVVVGGDSSKVGMLGNTPLINIPSSTPYIRKPIKHAMALGDVEGTFIRAGHQCGKTLQTQELMDELLKQQVRQHSEDIRDARSFLEGSIGVRRTVKSLYSRLKVIQQFNEVMTGYPRPIQVFFPDALAITLFATNHLKVKPGQFRPVVPDDRWVFTGLVKHYMETQQ